MCCKINDDGMFKWNRLCIVESSKNPCSLELRTIHTATKPTVKLAHNKNVQKTANS